VKYMKRCTKCGVEKEVTTEYFTKQKRNKDGLRATCKTCIALYYQENKEHIAKYGQENKERIAEYRQENKEHITEYGKQYYQENKEHLVEYSKQYQQENKEYIAEQKKQYGQENKERMASLKVEYYQENKERIAKYHKQYRQENKKLIAERNKQYQQDNPEKFNSYKQRRRARKRRLDSTLTFEQWENIKEDFNHKCAYCGKEDKLEQEHFLPLSKGGEYTHNNIIPACRSCNGSKRDKLFHEWYPNHKNYSKKREKTILKYLGYDKKIQQLSIL